MMNSEDKSLVFDTSTIIKLARQYHGFEIVKELFKKVENKKINGFISNLTSYETIITFGERGIRESIKILDNLETAGFKSIGFSKETARKAALLRIKHPETNLSTADCLIIQTAIDNNLTAVTADKEWGKVKDAKVIVV
ncbi:MAG: PIN domain-containing protein [Candidatus Diapherotrites archaeon]|uniref:PIN domain-containing protein n=1 Tax=Candidatus Iainarchaeum sp. TaxID=3101447 RepID=A0A7J4K020_9ARCH|nr:PIN domain-containing protein [Candidatus Diapherotrites archaeon]HIH21865.1 type II toxin-antitoxin system VapC family toxin [Candidatus Diapherotrites archaeon]